MTNLIEMLAIPAVAIGTYILVSKQVTKFFMNGGKNEQQIIKSHENDTNKRFLIKYPEADIKTSKHMLMAFGFIFAFASSIYAFNILGVGETYILPTPLTAEGDFEIIPPIVDMKKKVIKKEIPKITMQSKIIVSDELPPDLIEEKVEKEITKETVMADDIIIEDNYEGEKVEVEDKIFVVVEEMPKYKGCEGLDLEEAKKCTEKNIQTYVANMNIPSAIIDRGLGGKVYVKFVVGRGGKVQDVEIIKGANDLLDKAVLRHIKKMPNFASAGKQRGKEVKVQYVIPVNIVLE